MLFWAVIGFSLIPLFLVMSKMSSNKEEQARKLKRIQRRLAEKEAQGLNENNEND